MLIIVDDPDRENEGDLVMAAELVTPKDVNFITREGRGILCLPITKEKAKDLQLDLMVQNNTALHGTPFSISIDYRHGTSTGISAHDRAITINRATDKKVIRMILQDPGTSSL